MDNKILKDTKTFSQIQQAVEIFTCYDSQDQDILQVNSDNATEKSLKISLIRIFEHLAGAQLNNWRQNKNENKTRNT